jgi:hypothetical protein
MAQVVIRFRNQNKAYATAKQLAAASQRTIGVRKYDARTWEVYTQVQDMDAGTLAAMRKMSEAFNHLSEN